MSCARTRGLFAQVEAYFTDYLPKQRGASVHTVRAYRDALALLIKFVAGRLGRGVASLQLSDLDADAVTRFLDHIELERSNTASTRNCRRAAIRGFFKHLLRNDLAHSQQYMRVLAIPAKKARQRPATYLEAEEVRPIINMPDRRTHSGWRDYTLLLLLYNCGARVSEAAGLKSSIESGETVFQRVTGYDETIELLFPELAERLGSRFATDQSVISEVTGPSWRQPQSFDQPYSQ